jgi:hypothetical protein
MPAQAGIHGFSLRIKGVDGGQFAETLEGHLERWQGTAEARRPA